MVKWLEKALFSPQSPTSLGVFRALACGLCCLSLIVLSLHFTPWFSESGMWPRAFQDRWGGGIPRLNLLYWNDQDWVSWAVLGAAILSSFLAALGLFTRVSLAVLFISLVSLHHRSPDILNSGDTLIRQWIFILLVSPCAAGFSLDRWRTLKAGREAVSQISSWPQRLIQIQLVIVYLTTVWHKWEGDLWREGIATYTSAQLREFDRFPMPGFFQTQPFIAIETYGALVIEVALGTLVFHPRFRGWVLLGGLLLHGIIEYSMNIPFFAAIICSGYLAHYRGEEIEAFFGRLTAKLGPPSGADRESGSAQTEGS
jgi:hypothetical protein